MKIYLNQQPIEVAIETTVRELLDSRQIALDGTAVAVNNKLVPKSEWETFQLNNDDKLTVIRATFGG